MNATVHSFSVWAGSGMNLVAAVYAVPGELTLRKHIDHISYKIVDITPVSPDPDVEGTIDISNMAVIGQPWVKNRRDGYSFYWMMPGDLVPSPNHKYRIIITFTLLPEYGGTSFILVWQANTKDPEG